MTDLRTPHTQPQPQPQPSPQPQQHPHSQPQPHAQCTQPRAQPAASRGLRCPHENWPLATTDTGTPDNPPCPRRACTEAWGPWEEKRGAQLGKQPQAQPAISRSYWSPHGNWPHATTDTSLLLGNPPRLNQAYTEAQSPKKRTCEAQPASARRRISQHRRSEPPCPRMRCALPLPPNPH